MAETHDVTGIIPRPVHFIDIGVGLLLSVIAFGSFAYGVYFTAELARDQGRSEIRAQVVAGEVRIDDRIYDTVRNKKKEANNVKNQ